MNSDACFSKTLVLEGALHPGGAAVTVGDRVAAWEALSSGPRGAAGLFSAARRVLARSGLTVRDLTGIVVDVGPGSFTGLRVALGLAQGLSAGRPGLSVIGIEAPRVLAAAAGARLPVWVGIPWGRLRVLLARPAAPGRQECAVLLGRQQVSARRELRRRRIVVPPALVDMELPASARRVVAEQTPVLALAELTARGVARARGSGPAAPRYAVPPDAALPSRQALVPDGAVLFELTPADLPGLVALERACFRDPWSEPLLREELAPLPARMALGIRDEHGTLQAAMLASLVADQLSIRSVAVTPAARGRGLARALVREAVARARARGAIVADLEVRVDNAPAIALYASEGFSPVGVRRRYYQDGADALLMSLTLRRV